jgi:hypothetical protein
MVRQNSKNVALTVAYRSDSWRCYIRISSGLSFAFLFLQQFQRILCPLLHTIHNRQLLTTFVSNEHITSSFTEATIIMRLLSALAALGLLTQAFASPLGDFLSKTIQKSNGEMTLKPDRPVADKYQYQSQQRGDIYIHQGDDGVWHGWHRRSIEDANPTSSTPVQEHQGCRVGTSEAIKRHAYFQIPGSSMVISVATNWVGSDVVQGYMTRLRKRLENEAGLISIPNPRQECGWTEVMDVFQYGIDRARVDVGTPNGDAANVEISLELLGTIEHILKDTYPIFELGIVLGSSLFFVTLVVVGIWWRKRKQRDACYQDDMKGTGWA